MSDPNVDDVLNLADAARKGLEGAERLAWIERLTSAYERIRAALCSLLQSGETERGVELLGNLYWFLAADDSRRREAREWYRLCLARGIDLPPRLRARAFDLAGGLALNDGDFAEARRWCDQALATHRDNGDRVGMGYSLSHLGHIAQETGDMERAWQLRVEALNIFRSLDDKLGIMTTTYLLGELALDRHDAAAAAPLVRESVQFCWTRQQEVFYASYLDLAASCALEIGHASVALRLAGAAESVRRRLGLIPESVQEGTPLHRFLRKLEQRWDTPRNVVPENDRASLRAEGRRMTTADAFALALEIVAIEPSEA